MKYYIYCRKSSEDKNKQVSSIPDQLTWTEKIKQERTLNVVGVFTDTKTATKPGRENFEKMMLAIEKEPEGVGILTWKVDRLARNPIDEGAVKYAFMHGKIKHILAMDREYREGESQILMSVDFGSATQYSIDLSKNVKRGMDSKIEKGWRPGKALLGYLNEIHALKGEKRILPDPDLFPIIQKLWKLLLTEKYSLMGLYRYMQNNCPVYRKGKLLAFSTFCRIFHNPFYAGLFEWLGGLRIGAHKAMITQGEFEKAQKILKQETVLRERDLQFDLKGLFRCGCCDALITAERHTKTVKKTGEQKDFDYYRCVHRKGKKDCREKGISAKAVQEHVLMMIENMELPEEVIKLGLEELDAKKSVEEETIKEKQIKREIIALKKNVEIGINNITAEPDSEIRGLMKSRINELKIKKRGLEENLRKHQQEKQDPYLDIKNTLNLILRAKTKFLQGSPEEKKDIVRGLGSNWILKGQRLYCEPHFSAFALQEAKKFYLGVKHRIEPSKSLSQAQNLCSDVFSFIWSGYWELIGELFKQIEPSRLFGIKKIFQIQVSILTMYYSFKPFF